MSKNLTNGKKDKEIKIKEQDDIMACNKSLIVSASAGSGKTTIMIKKIFEYLKSGDCNAEQLLVLTYTNLAAAEMKKKLINKLKENLQENPSLIEQIEQIPTSDISTFDSFCQRLVKKYFYVIGIDPSFNILSGEKEELFKNIAIDNAIALTKKENPKDYEVLTNNLTGNRKEDNIKNVIFKIHSYIISLINIDEFFKKTEKLYKKEEKIAENYLKSYYNDIFIQIKNQLLDLIEGAKNLDFLSYVEYINNLLSIAENSILSDGLTKMISLYDGINYGRLDKDDKDINLFWKKIESVKTKLKKTIDDIKKLGNADEISNTYLECESLCHAIIVLEKTFIKQYEILKKSKNYYDFNDIERMTIKLLEDKKINEQVKNSYKHIFVDEFQDANAIQEKIIFLLDNNNLFFVGDTKQSIYAFRQSDPDIFLNIQENFKTRQDAESLPLNCNFRTNKNILYFANNIFSVLMTKNTSGVDYKKDAQFDPKATFEDLNNEVCVSLNLLNVKKKDEPIIATEVYDLTKNQNSDSNNLNTKNQCIFICDQITHLLGQDIYDNAEEKTRKINLSDITILLLKSGHFVDELLNTFDEYGISYNADMGENIDNEYDNRVLFGALKLSLNIKDDYTLYKVLHSKLFDFTDTELGNIKLCSNKEYFYEALEDYKSKQDELSKKIENFYKVIDDLHFNCKYNGIYFALNKLLENTNYLLKIDENYTDRKNKIYQYIYSFMNSQYNNDLIEYITYKNISKKQDKIKIDNSSNNSIKICTMHSSKGLEYPIVILPNLDSDYTKNMEEREIKINKQLGIGVKAYNNKDRTITNGIFYEACNINNKNIEQSEKIRLLYVAITRAKNKLILIGNNQENYKKFESDYEIMSQNNFLSMLVNSLDKSIIDKINNNEFGNYNLFNNPRLKLNIIDKIVITSSKTDESKIYNIDNQNLIKDFLSKDLSKNKIELALKNSVSGFAFDNSSINLAPKNLTIYEHLLETSSQLGTLYHKVLEDVNFNDINSVNDVSLFLDCNLSDEEKELFKDISIDNVYKNISILKDECKTSKNILKEQKFVMKVKHSDLVDGGYDDKILVQGIIDLVAVFNDKIVLIDYKLTHKPNNDIISKYKKQLSIYKLALSKNFKNIPIYCKILNLYKNELINI